jgi:DNA-binding FadR family transcriptional regulator
VNLVATVAEQLHAEILSSGLKQGELFMTGGQIAQRYEVSRTVAREAINQLCALGVLESRRRKGVLVTQPDPVKLSASWVPMFGRVAGVEGFRMLAQWRYVLELGAVDLAVDHGSQEQAARLSVLADQFEAVAAKHGHSAAADQIDLAFHAVILEMTGNPLVAGMHRVLADYFLASAEYDPNADAPKAIREHHIIAEAFQRRDRETVRSVLRSHLQSNIQASPG